MEQIDGSDNVVSFDLPIEKLAVAHMPEFIVALGEFQKVVGVPSYMLTDDVLTEIYPDIKNLPDFGKTGSFDREALKRNPQPSRGISNFGCEKR